MTINQLFSVARKAQNISIEDLAEYVGVSQSTIAAYEKGRKIPEDNVRAISNRLAIPVSVVLDTKKKAA